MRHYTKLMKMLTHNTITELSFSTTSKCTSFTKMQSHTVLVTYTMTHKNNKNVIVNVNVYLYSTSSQKAPLMRSMCRVLIKKTVFSVRRKQSICMSGSLQIVLEQVPCHWSSDSEGATAVRVDGGWRNEDAVVQPLTLQLANRMKEQ